jgi:hypothetical protein
MAVARIMSSFVAVETTGPPAVRICGAQIPDALPATDRAGPSTSVEVSGSVQRQETAPCRFLNSPSEDR